MSFFEFFSDFQMKMKQVRSLGTKLWNCTTILLCLVLLFYILGWDLQPKKKKKKKSWFLRRETFSRHLVRTIKKDKSLLFAFFLNSKLIGCDVLFRLTTDWNEGKNIAFHDFENICQTTQNLSFIWEKNLKIIFE